MLKYANIDGMKRIEHNDSRRGGAFDIPEDAYWRSNSSIIQRLYCLPAFHLISQCCEYGMLEV